MSLCAVSKILSSSRCVAFTSTTRLQLRTRLVQNKKVLLSYNSHRFFTTNKSTSRITNSATRIDMDLDAVDLQSMTFMEETSEHDPVILLHGLLGQKRNFASLGNALAKQLQKKRQIFALDLRNHGDNHNDWRSEMSYSHMANDVLAFLDKNQIDKAIIIGHSMGGKVAKSLALANPDRVAGLVVLDIAPVTYTKNDPSWNAVEGIIQSLKCVELHVPGKTKRDVDIELRSSVEDPAIRAFVLTNLDIVSEGGVQTLRWKINVDAIADQLHRLAGFDVKSMDLSSGVESSSSLDDMDSASFQYDGDTFLIKGGASSFVKNSHIPLIKKHFPNFMLTSIKGCGHWVHAESPDQTVALLKKYLDR